VSRSSLVGVSTALATVALVLALVAGAPSWLTVAFVLVVLVLVFALSAQRRGES
jgi:cbb3-type cytochrome oxidase subunit 3